MMSTILTTYRATIVEGLRDALAGTTPLRGILRYHVGLEEVDGTPADAIGKLLRPSLVLFMAEQMGGSIEAALPAAVGLELVHNFSLIHDDIQDRDDTRRGRPAVWTLYGVSEAINAGDLMHTLAISIALHAGPYAARRLTEATEQMIEGQSRDLEFEQRPVEVEEYLGMIDRKTGALLRCACELGGIVARSGSEIRAAQNELGLAVGRAFQIQDDLLGIWGDPAVIGKPQGSDIRRRKKSYPVALLFSAVSPEDRERLDTIYRQATTPESDLTWVMEMMEQFGIRETGTASVREHSETARRLVDRLPLSAEGKEALLGLIEALAGREK